MRSGAFPPDSIPGRKPVAGRSRPAPRAKRKAFVPDIRARILADPGSLRIMEGVAVSTGLTVALEQISPLPGAHGAPCGRMSRLGPGRVHECEARRSHLLSHAAGSGSSSLISCPVGSFCLAVPIYVLGKHAATLRAGGFTKRMGASKARVNAIRELLLLVADELGHRAESLLAHLKSGSKAVNLATDYMHAHMSEPVRMHDIAVGAGVSRQHLARIWKKNVGVTLHADLIAIRIEHAKALLEAGDRKIIETALECGFGSVSQFNRAFLQATGVSPSRWLKQRR